MEEASHTEAFANPRNGEGVSLRNDEQGDLASGGSHSKQMCRFFSQRRPCMFGEKCRFLHVRGEGKSHQSELNKQEGPQAGQSAPQSNPSSPIQVSRSSPTISALAARTSRREKAARRPCRYFLSGYCAMEDGCRFPHPQLAPPVGNLSAPVREPETEVRRPPARAGMQEVKLWDLTEEASRELRDSEIRQLKKRFPRDQLIIQEGDDGQLTLYRATVQATDPDWPFDLKEVDIIVSFPEKYPQEIFTLIIPADQHLPSVMGRHVQQAAVEWLQAKHATNQLMGKVELLLLAFLRWLDRSLERLFTEGARQLKKDMMAEQAGLEFVPFEQLQAAVCREPGGSETPSTAAQRIEEEEGGGEEEEAHGNEQEEDEEEEGCRLVENIRISEPRRGTEVQLLGLRLGEQAATLEVLQLTVSLQCNRCKVTADLTLSGRSPCSAQCQQCHAGIGAAFRPGMIHAFSHVLGYLDLQNAAAVDLVLQDCDLSVGCLACSQQNSLQKLSYGIPKDFCCQHCHSKLSVHADSTRFLYIQPRSTKSGANDTALHLRRSPRDPAIQKGKPLPGGGTCRHYRQSHRWLRFPCCGRAYPCDVCHDDAQDHGMELATRMICGHCAKEQPYANGKPCCSCGNMLTRGGRTSHWEGGLGCRNKVRMNRNDRQKYSNTNKTISRKAAAERS